MNSMGGQKAPKDQARVIFSLCILISTLLTWVLSVVAFAGPWCTFNILTTASFFLTYSSSGTGAAPVPYPATYVGTPIGAAALAFFVLAFLSSLVAFLGAGVEVASAFNLPLQCIPIGVSSSAPKAALIGSWVAFSSALIGLACGVTFVTLMFGNQVSTSSGVTFPGRDAASSAFSFSLIAAILQTVHMKLCCCCNLRGAAGRSGSAVISSSYITPNAAFAPAPSATIPSPSAAQSSQWKKLTDGNDTWFLNVATNESAWDLPPGGRVVV